MNHDDSKPKARSQEQTSGSNRSLGEKPVEKPKRAFSVASAPSMELPKGGGAIRGLGETFKVNAATGTASFGIPLPLSASPRGVTPELGLSYDSGSGNSPFGLGWSVSVPSITRKTDKKIPEYLDSEDSDTFLLAGADDLVPMVGLDGLRVSESTTVGTITTTIERFRPRIEGLFAKIERVTVKNTSPTSRAVYWQVTTRDNVTSTYGKTESAVISDPKFAHKRYSWLLERTEDDRGNVVLYEYKQEDAENQPLGKPSETNRRNGYLPITANRYLKRVRYGNVVPSSNDPDDFMFQLVLDYGEHTTDTDEDVTPWPCRQDMFSSFRAGFEIRTYRLCRRVLMFHHFADLAPSPCLVRSLDLTYDETKRMSKLTSARITGYEWDAGTSAYTTKSLPPVTLQYTSDAFSRSIKRLTKEDLGDDFPSVALGKTAEWVDLDQEGLPGILIDQGGAHRYKRNVGGKLYGGATLSSVPTIKDRPVQLLDVAGSGTLSMVLKEGNTSGYAERTESGWAPFTPFKSFPNIDVDDPNLRFVDLNGDGFDDILITRGDHLLWYPSLGRDGYGYARRIPTPSDRQQGPRVVFAEQAAAVFIADMNGDGLADIVRVTCSGVMYWPNLGHGRFGAMVQMDTAPRLAPADFYFDGRRVRLVDLDGTGCADLGFFHDEWLKIYRNQSGNSFDEGEQFYVPTEAQFTGQFVDFYGAGTSAFIYYLRSIPTFNVMMWDPLEHRKPHLLREVDNHRGRVVRLEYAPSTKFYVEDRRRGRRWVTKLPFPVQVVERVETYDAIRRARLVTTYEYHHGHYDTHEREFRGFGFVEQRDAELFGEHVGQGSFPDFPPAVNDEIPQHPVLTKTWFHTGAWKERAAQGAQYLTEYWAGDSLADTHLECSLPAGITVKELKEAARALRGSVLRQEVFAIDGSDDTAKPFTVTETSYEVRRLQPPLDALGQGRPHLPGVFHLVENESRSFSYERVASDPRISQTLALHVDAYGTVTKSASIAYPRRTAHQLHDEQDQLLCVVSERLVAHCDESSTGYRLGIPVETRAFQLTGYSAPGDGVFLALAAVREDFTGATEIAYDASPDTGFEKRLIQQEVVRYYDTTSLPDLLAFGAVDPKALTYESYLLDVTPTLLTTVFGSAVTSGILTEAGYTAPGAASGHWLPSGHAVFDAAHFYLPVTLVDPFGNETVVAYDEDSWMFATSVTDPLGNVVSTEHDHRVLAPFEVTEPNGNRQRASFDELGMLKHVALMGKSGGADGDTLSDPTVIYSYALSEWDDDAKPNFVHVSAREVHGSSSSPWRESKVFSDGSGGVAMTKTQAEPAPGTADPRWVGSGRTVLNNKGNPIKQYEPYFSENFDFENEDEIVATGVTALVTYDPLGRVIRTDFPNGTASRVTRTAWVEILFDQNDTINDDGNIWSANRAGLPSSNPQKKALLRTQDHALTPTETHLDAMGRAFLVRAHNKIDGADEFHDTRTTLDVQGRVLQVVDALERVCQTNVYSVAGALLKETNLDKGSRTNLYDTDGRMVRRFDGRDQVFRASYDSLRRPTHLYMKPGAAAEQLLQRTMFGDDAGITTPEANNLRGKVVRLFDGAGRTTSESYDFKGNSLSSVRNLAVEYMTAPDWSALASETTASGIDSAASSLLESETFAESRTFDAMNRITKVTTPDASEFVPTYNEAGLLEAVEVKVRGAGTATTFISNIDYDAKGQRSAIVYGNGTATTYTYDPLTFRLATLVTTRTSPSATLQDLSYTYDPVGNVIQVADAAHQVVFFDNAVVLPENEYVYDAVYRLISAKGREHKSIGLVQVDNNDCPLESLPHANDSDALRNYEETYEYDKVGNILEMFHDAGTNTWTRTYAYESSPSTNRLASHNIPGGTATYTHDVHGSMTSMPHLSGGITWTPLDQMQSASNGTQDTYFTYAADGARVRKVYDTNANLIKERIYLGSFEVYRERTSSGVQVERETLHVNDGTKRLAMVETKTRSGGAPVATPVPMFRFQLGNHLGSAVLEVDDTGLVISYEETSPYGSTCYRSSDGSVDVSARRYRYVGLERDEETGLYLMGARYYAAWLGRWTSADPLGIGADGPGIYNYARNCPTVLVDLSGTDTRATQQLTAAEDEYLLSMEAAVGSADPRAAEAAAAERLSQAWADYEATAAEEDGGSEAAPRRRFEGPIPHTGARATATFEPDAVTLHSQLVLAGQGADEAAMEVIQSRITDVWALDPETGGAWVVAGRAVNFNVQTSLLTETGKIPPGDHVTVVELKEGVRSHTKEDEVIWNSAQIELEAPHEFGHVLGAKDRYDDVYPNWIDTLLAKTLVPEMVPIGAETHPGWEGNIMGGAGGGARVEQRNIDAIVDPILWRHLRDIDVEKSLWPHDPATAPGPYRLEYQR